jgi:CHAT domain-containing protein
MATYWTTSNSGQSEQFMAAFYSAAKDRSITQSVNQAQRTLLSDPQTSHPYFWAGFFVVGQTENRVLDDGKPRVAAR